MIKNVHFLYNYSIEAQKCKQEDRLKVEEPPNWTKTWQNRHNVKKKH